MKNYIIPETGEVRSYEDILTLTDIKKLPKVPQTIKTYSGVIPDETYDYTNNVWVLDPAKVALKEMAAKWTAVGEFWSALTVTINGNKYKADEAGANRMALKRDALAADATTTWYEEWGSFSTNKVDLQDAIAQADAELQTFIDATMAAV